VDDGYGWFPPCPYKEWDAGASRRTYPGRARVRGEEEKTLDVYRDVAIINSINIELDEVRNGRIFCK
jgi:hypothetical protein